MDDKTKITTNMLMIAPRPIRVQRAEIISISEYSPTPKVAAKNPSAETIIDVTDDVSAIRIASFFSFPLHRSFLYRVVIKIA